MKKDIRIVAWVLALTMTFVLMTAGVSAEENKWQLEGDYVAFGDSVSRGFGATKDNHITGTYGQYTKRIVEGAFPYRIAQAYLPAETIIDDADVWEGNSYWPICYAGMTVTALLDYLQVEDGFYDEEYDHCGIENGFGTYAFKRILGEKPDAIIEKIKGAGLITIELGMCDVLYRSSIVSQAHSSSTAELVARFTEEMNGNFAQWEKSYPLFLQWLKEINPKATIVMVGAYNMHNGVDLSRDIVFPAGNLVSIMIAAMNEKYREWEETYDVLFADIFNIEAGGMEQGLSFVNDRMNNVANHPTVEGNAYIARQVMAVLEGVEKNRYDIVLDLCCLNAVDAVYLDGKPVKKYTLDGWLLTVPYKNANAENLTVTYLNEEGCVELYSYRLHYNRKDGYRAYLAYGAHDAVSKVEKTAGLLSGIGKRIQNAVNQAFQR